MLKKILTITALLAIIGLLVWGGIIRTQAMVTEEGTSSNHGNTSTISLAATTSPNSNSANAPAEDHQNQARSQGENGNTHQPQDMSSLFASDPTGLSPAEQAALIYMREEEKLAHDVYTTLFAQWNLPIFDNISQSEQEHTDSVKALLDHFGLADPASSEIGVFTNPELQALYTDLTAQGSLSLADALKVGAAIEEIDILDLQDRLSQTDNADIQNVFNNLLSGSYNHLRAFVAVLGNKTGEIYQPQYLNAETYQAILSDISGNGGGQGGGGGGKGNGGRP